MVFPQCINDEMNLSERMICTLTDVILASVLLVRISVTYLTLKLVRASGLHLPCFIFSKGSGDTQTYECADWLPNRIDLRGAELPCSFSLGIQSLSSLEGENHTNKTCGAMNCICPDCTSLYSFAGSIRESDDANEIEKQLEREQSFKVFPEELADCLISMDCDERDKLHAMADADDLCTCLPECISNNSSILVAVSEVPKKSRTCVAGGAQITSSNADLCAEKLVRGIFPKAPDLVENASFDNLLKDSGVSVVQVRRRLAEIVNDTYLELEKERRASASAADEAIATITRLQEEKTALKME